MKRLLRVLVVLAALCAPVSAQEQRASIEGIVRDSSGGVLPGVTIEARSPSMAGVQATVTDPNGLYRFPALPPGRYDVNAMLQGFQPAKSSDVRLELGQILKIDLVLDVGGLTESVRSPASRRSSTSSRTSPAPTSRQRSSSGFRRDATLPAS